MLTIYGIKNCDTMKKAMRWLDEQQLPYTFHDYKKSGIDAEILQQWVAAVSWEVLVNTRGTTWRRLPDEDKAHLDADKAIAIMQANTSVIKRPVLTNGEQILVGFDANKWTALLRG